MSDHAFWLKIEPLPETCAISRMGRDSRYYAAVRAHQPRDV